MLPLWSSYLVKVYAWKLILAKEGIISWLAGNCISPGRWMPSRNAGYRRPVAVHQLPRHVPGLRLCLAALHDFADASRAGASSRNLIDASSDLGGTPAQTFRHVIFPLALPGIIAGSIFTFSLTLGDYIIPQIIGNSSYFLGQTVYTLQGTAGNIPLAAAFTVVPIVIMGIYLAIAKGWEPSMRSEGSPCY